MTHVNTMQAMSNTKRIGIIFCLVMITQSFMACTSNNALTIPNLAASDPNAAAQQKASANQVALTQIIGVPSDIAKKFSGTLIKTASDQKLALTDDKAAKSAYTVQGYLVAAAADKGTKVTYIWDVADKTGKHAHRIKGEKFISDKKPSPNADPWKMLTDENVQTIATDTVTRLATWLPKEQPSPSSLLLANNNTPATTGSVAQSKTSSTSANKTAASTTKNASIAKPAAKSKSTAKTNPKPSKPVKLAAQKSVATKPVKVAAKPTSPKPPAEPTQVTALIPTVLGAPGDGKSSLTSAIRRQLNSRGIVLAGATSKAAYTVKGEVKMLPANQSGREDIAIEWRVIDPSGKKLGTVSQRNTIPKGSLDGAWGQTADAAASAAADGIVKLLPSK